MIPASAAVKVLNRPHSIIADVEIPSGGVDGILLSHGGIDGGYSFYIKTGKLHWVHNYVSRAFYHVEFNENVPGGRHQLGFEFEVTGKPDFANGKGSPGIAKLFIDGTLVGQIKCTSDYSTYVRVNRWCNLWLSSWITSHTRLSAPLFGVHRQDS